MLIWQSQLVLSLCLALEWLAFLINFPNRLYFLILFVSPLCRELQVQACEWFYGQIKCRFRRFGSAKVVRSLYKRNSEGCKLKKYHKNVLKLDVDLFLLHPPSWEVQYLAHDTHPDIWKPELQLHNSSLFVSYINFL